MPSQLRRWHQASSELAAHLAAICVAATAVSYTVEVIARYFLADPLNLSGDLGGYLLCPTVFLALPKVTADGAHVAITFIEDRMSAPVRQRYLHCLYYITAAVCICVTYFIAAEGLRQYHEHVLTTAANQIPKWLISAVACYGLASSSLHLLFPRKIEAREQVI